MKGVILTIVANITDGDANTVAEKTSMFIGPIGSSRILYAGFFFAAN